MAKKRPIKKTSKTVAKATPKKRVKKKTTTKKKVKPNFSTNRKINPSDYIRVSEKSIMNKFIEIGKRVYKGELRWMYYAIDGNIGYHYYKKLK
tara:strand:+ start:399 stop:677 length:279 start_codon:yes stop_codon:yes gene_type:complete